MQDMTQIGNLLWVFGNVLILQIFSVEATTDYCKFTLEHTMCLFKKDGPSSNCSKYHSKPFTLQEKELILDIHNKMRSYVANGMEIKGSPGPQPKAANMQSLKWDDELASVAQRWADQCITNYDPNHHNEYRDVDRFPVGQNIAVSVSQNPHEDNLEEKIMTWYNEVQFFDKSIVINFSRNFSSSVTTDEYTQMVWAKTYLIGCGRVLFADGAFYYDKLICNYGPGGNVVGASVYKIGNPCVKLPYKECNEKYKGLYAGKPWKVIWNTIFKHKERLIMIYFQLFYGILTDWQGKIYSPATGYHNINYPHQLQA